MKSVKEIRESIYNYLNDNDKMFLETRVSLLIPDKDLNESAFIFSELRAKDGTKISQPTALVVCDSGNGKITSYKELIAKEDKLLWEYCKNTLTIEQQKMLAQKLLEIYDKIRGFSFAEKAKLDKTNQAMLGEYLAIFDKVVPDCLKKRYFEIGADFFLWVKQE